MGGFYHPKRTGVVCEERKEDSALTGDQPIVEVQIIGEEQQPIIEALSEERPASPTTSPVLSRANQVLQADSMEDDMSSAEAVKRKRSSCSSEEWKKIIVESDQQYVGVLHSLLESETQHREEELQMKREEIQLRREDVQHMKEEASTSSALQGQLVCVLGQIAELFKTKQAAPLATVRTPPGRNAPSSAASQATRWEAQPGRALHARTQSRAETGAAPHQTLSTESHEENRPREMENIIKIETEESMFGQQRADAAPINVDAVPMQYEESRTQSTTQEAAAIAVQRDLLAAQREQCRLMAENNSIQRTLVRAVSRGNRCVSDLAKSIRAQTAVSTAIQDRIVQLLERQEWTNQLLTMKVMGGSSASSQNPQEAREAFTLPSARPSSAYQSVFSGKGASELLLTSSAADQCNS
ncbi:hypothetical protein SKAU_G00037850 [Synaphobranchus kaupii]|uniref:Uncharacterized protein n=1 Tax=Synaphobranchus kaupii TaxID=118154 RepID=A0A9Q1JH77_SYNKA|nr:hypothetical protein SKAU_G00037850 [Synaphobranchus kaupii]